jgi:hypothetical protein
MTDFEQALDALRASMPPPRRSPRARPVDPALEEWRRRRAEGAQAGSQTQRMHALRMALLDAGLWREVYR